MQQVQGSFEDDDGLLVPVHLLRVGIGIGLNLLTDLVHESSMFSVESLHLLVNTSRLASLAVTRTKSGLV